MTSSSSSEVNGDGPPANGNLEAAADVAELNVATPSASIPCTLNSWERIARKYSYQTGMQAHFKPTWIMLEDIF